MAVRQERKESIVKNKIEFGSRCISRFVLLCDAMLRVCASQETGGRRVEVAAPLVLRSVLLLALRHVFSPTVDTPHLQLR